MLVASKMPMTIGKLRSPSTSLRMITWWSSTSLMMIRRSSICTGTGGLQQVRVPRRASRVYRVAAAGRAQGHHHTRERESYLTMSATVLLSAAAPPSDLRVPLATAGFAVTDHALGSTPAVDFAPVAVAVIEVGGKTDAAIHQTRRWRAELRDEALPIVWVLPGADAELAVRGLDAGADVVLARPVDEAVFVAQVRAAVRLRATSARVAAQAAEARLLGDQLRK